MINFVRNPWVAGALPAAALTVVIYQFLAPRWHRRDVVGQSPLPGGAAPAAQAPPANATVRGPGKSPAPAGTNGSPDKTLDRTYAESHFPAWVNSPRRDPFLLMGVDHGQDKANSETNSPVLHWKLKAIWKQTGGRLAVINRGVYGEGDEIEGYKVVRIEGDEVWFQGPKRSERLGFDRPEAPILAAPFGASPNPQSSGSEEKKPSGPRS